MSYSIGLYFKKNINSMEDAIEFANSFLENFDFDSYVNDVIFYILNTRDAKIDLSKWRVEFSESHDIIKHCEEKISQELKFKFIFFKEAKLLGFIYQLENKFPNIFDSYVYFQNSTDQDYPFEIWNNISPCVDEIVNRWKNMSLENFKQYCESKNELDFFEEIMSETKDETSKQESFQYYLRSNCYQEIVKLLGIERYLYRRYDKEKDTHPFPWVPINLYIDTNDYWKEIKSAISKAIDNLKEDFPFLFNKKTK